MKKLRKLYERETGNKALYRMNSSDYHTLKYVEWLENKINLDDEIKQEMLEALTEVAKLSCDHKGTLLDYAWNSVIYVIAKATGQTIDDAINNVYESI